MMVPIRRTSDPPREGPCARCVIGALLGTVVAAWMLLVTARALSAVARGRVRLRRS